MLEPLGETLRSRIENQAEDGKVYQVKIQEQERRISEVSESLEAIQERNRRLVEEVGIVQSFTGIDTIDDSLLKWTFCESERDSSLLLSPHANAKSSLIHYCRLSFFG